MIQKVCDRCGRMIQEVHPLSNVCTSKILFPMITISMLASPTDTTQGVDLCHDCSLAFLRFIHEDEEDDD